jgi:hypothetical protein
MKRHTSLLMAMIAASIFLFFLLNLLIGSVDIPLSSVVNILLGGEEQSVVWQNIVLKSRVPQALTALVAGAGLSISGLQMQTVFAIRWQVPRYGYQFGSQFGRCFCRTYFGEHRRRGVKQHGLFRRNGIDYFGYHWGFCGYGHHRIRITKSKRERYVTHSA